MSIPAFRRPVRDAPAACRPARRSPRCRPPCSSAGRPRTCAFFPAYWPAGLAAVAALLTFLGPRLGLAFALAVPVLPLGNISLGLAIAYAIAACAWFALFWAAPRRPALRRRAVAGAFGALGLVPLAALPARRARAPGRLAVAAVLGAGIVAALGGHRPAPGRRQRPTSRSAGSPADRRGLGAAGTALTGSHCVPARDAGARPRPRPPSAPLRRRGPWGGALFGATPATLTLLADRALPRCRSSPRLGARCCSHSCPDRAGRCPRTSAPCGDSAPQPRLRLLAGS